MKEPIWDGGELGRLIAADVHWVIQRMGSPPGMVLPPSQMIADTRYTRIIQRIAEQVMTELEADSGDGD